MADDMDVLGRIKALVEEEHALNAAGGGMEQHERRQRVEEELDQCWDLLRQRQALRDAGQDPSAAHTRPVSQVESYLQ
jgi:hypothetical protein